MKVAGDSPVPNKINGLETKPVRVAPGAAVQRRQDAAPESGGHPGGSDLQLTGTARNVAALSQALLEKPAIDEARVAAVKAKLESGDYAIDPQRIADKLLRMESDLSRVAPFDKSLLK
ncbi:MAG: flagellar biosynthesis anti-sigma factor FlgM [Steroidobacteraceae bacterium]